MDTKKMLSVLTLGTLSILVIVVYVATQNAGNRTLPSDVPSIQQQEDVGSQYEGAVVFVSDEGDLVHILEREAGLLAISVPAELRSDTALLEDGSTVVLLGTMDDDQNPGLIRLQQILSVESGNQLSPEDAARLNSEFRDLRL